MASSSKWGGSIRAVLRLVKRSMTSASATMEQASKGQMGQPAATMIENKEFSGSAEVRMRGDYRRTRPVP